MKVRFGFLFWLVLGMVGCTPPTPPSGNGLPNDRPYVRLEDGRLVALNTLEEIEEARAYYETRLQDGNEAILEEEGPLPQGQPIRPLALPPSADLRANQTPIRDQWIRGTCTSFAVAALLEAAYKRLHGLELDLSEEWINGAQKMGLLISTGAPGAPMPLPLRENAIYGLSGGGVTWGLDHVLRYGIPAETHWPYNNTRPFLEKTDDPLDDPRVLWYGPITERQDYLDTFNLTHRLWTVQTLDERGREIYPLYRAPVTPFPNAAQQQAIYGPSHIVYARPEELIRLEWYKTQLAEGREIAFSAVLIGRRYGEEVRLEFRDNVWIPGPGPDSWGGHAMLMVGYDDARRVFLVKNSWGRDERGRGSPVEADPDGDGFVAMSYDWVTLGLIYEAAVVRAVRRPDGFSPAYPLGLWNINLDGFVTRQLGIYHLPRTMTNAILRERFSGAPAGAVDRRLGTFHIPGLSGFRVNGETLPALRFVRFWLLPDTASEPWRDLPDRVTETKEFRVIFFKNGRIATGFTEDWGVVMYRDRGVPSGSASVSGPPRAESFAGRWQVYDDDTSVPVLGEPLRGELRIRYNSGVLSGVYVYQGQEFPLKISYNANNPTRIQFEVRGLYGSSLDKIFIGYMMRGNKSLFVGHSGYIVGIVPILNGFYAERIGD
ncbi:C1 family peptidase [Meiothermus sp. QL-1]|uniref:C1 family peptidase n=1 Tax=Meiothermus sp. QL-1 TaxID=2058095 RepID=UPI0018F11D12|nr:C1 family peptidase [Meiothermus sp. QL-1]